MSLKINSEIPNIFVETSQGAFFIHDWLGEHWGIIFSHPKDFTPVCTTELGALAHLEKKFISINLFLANKFIFNNCLYKFFMLSAPLT